MIETKITTYYMQYVSGTIILSERSLLGNLKNFELFTVKF